MKWEGGKEEVEIQLYMYFIWRERGKEGGGERSESREYCDEFSIQSFWDYRQTDQPPEFSNDISIKLKKFFFSHLVLIIISGLEKLILLPGSLIYKTDDY